MDNFPSIADHSLIWIFGIIIPFISGLQSEKLSGGVQFDSSSRRRLYLANSLMLGIAGSIVLSLWAFKKRTWNSLGFRDVDNKHLTVTVIAILIFVLAYVVDTIITNKSVKKQGSTTDWFNTYSFLPQNKQDLLPYILLCACAGFFEEIIYRGFMVSYFMPLHDKSMPIPWIAILAPAFLFSLAHYYQGWTAVVKIGIFSMLFGVIYIYSKSLYPPMILHFLVDLFSGLFYMRQKKILQKTEIAQ
jgi:membrane protease YdiL (CAAX protease family)